MKFEKNENISASIDALSNLEKSPLQKEANPIVDYIFHKIRHLCKTENIVFDTKRVVPLHSPIYDESKIFRNSHSSSSQSSSWSPLVAPQKGHSPPGDEVDLV